jgi:hypothetical protein
VPTSTVVTSAATPSTTTIPTTSLGADAPVSVVTVAATPPGVARLAFADRDQMYVASKGGQPVAVGAAGTPVWSTDGRYLAWSRDERVRSTTPVLNEPDDRTVYLLDTVTGQRIRFHDHGRPLDGTVLAVDGGFVAVVSGKNNLGNAATDFVLLRPTELAAGRAAEVVHSKFDLNGNLTDYDFAWVQARGDRLYVVVTGRSTSSYRYSPQLWMVSLDGAASRLFDDCTAMPQCGLSNVGYPAVAVSPDGRHVAFEAGTRAGGCDMYFSAVLRESEHGRRIPLEGLPATNPANGGMRLLVRSIRWISNDEFLIDVSTSAVTISYDPSPQCDRSEPIRRLFRCSIEGRCVDTGAVTATTIASSAGDVAEIHAPPAGQSVSSVDVIWVGRVRQQIIVRNSGADLAWAP